MISLICLILLWVIDMNNFIRTFICLRLALNNALIWKEYKNDEKCQKNYYTPFARTVPTKNSLKPVQLLPGISWRIALFARHDQIVLPRTAVNEPHPNSRNFSPFPWNIGRLGPSIAHYGTLDLLFLFGNLATTSRQFRRQLGVIRRLERSLIEQILFGLDFRPSNLIF